MSDKADVGEYFFEEYASLPFGTPPCNIPEWVRVRDSEGNQYIFTYTYDLSSHKWVAHVNEIPPSG